MSPRVFTPLIVALALLVAACSSSDSVDTSDADPTTTTSAADSDAEADGDADNTDAADVDLTRKPDVVVPDGDAPTQLVVDDIVAGDGAEARPGDLLVMHYVGVLHSDGTEFDASWDRGDTFSFTLGGGRVIQGWDDGLVGMRVGGRRLLSIPAPMAYGDQARGEIPANSALVFVVDLIDLVAKPQVVNAPDPVTELEVTVLEEGTGDIVEAGDVVEVHYVMLLQPTGVVIDSTFDAGESRFFVIGVDPTQSIAAWDEGLVGKSVGDLVRLVIPPDLGFGADGGDVVGPDDTIITEVRIMNIDSTATEPASE